jgi:hypothetical protein
VEKQADKDAGETQQQHVQNAAERDGCTRASGFLIA